MTDTSKIQNHELVYQDPLGLGLATVTDKGGLVSSVADAWRFISNGVRGFSGITSGLHELRFFSLLSLPSMYNNVVGGFSMIRAPAEKTPVSQKLMAAADLIGEAGNTCDLLATTSTGILAVSGCNWAPIVALGAHATPLYIAGTVLSLPALGANSIRLGQACSFSKKLGTKDRLGGMIELTVMKSAKDEGFSQRNLDIDGKKLVSCLDRIDTIAKCEIAAVGTEFRGRGEARQKEAMETLRGRISSRKKSLALSLLVAAICLVAFPLLFFPPVAFAVGAVAIGWTLMGVASVMKIGDFFYQRKVNKQFVTAMNRLATI